VVVSPLPVLHHILPGGCIAEMTPDVTQYGYSWALDPGIVDGGSFLRMCTAIGTAVREWLLQCKWNQANTSPILTWDTLRAKKCPDLGGVRTKFVTGFDPQFLENDFCWLLYFHNHLWQQTNPSLSSDWKICCDHKFLELHPVTPQWRSPKLHFCRVAAAAPPV